MLDFPVLGYAVFTLRTLVVSIRDQEVGRQRRVETMETRGALLQVYREAFGKDRFKLQIESSPEPV